MKIIHVADLHFGKSLAGMNLVEDQRDWARRFVEFVKVESPAAVVIAGDVYDRGAPSGEAVELLDKFVTDLLAVNESLQVMIVSGNHDSGQRLAFGSAIFRKQRLHIVGKLSAKIDSVVLKDEHGPVRFWLMPYLFPAAVAQVLDRDERLDYTSAVKALLDNQNFSAEERNVLVAHQSVMMDGVEAEAGGSETMVGGVGSIDGRVFDGFDYVALGHIHKGQHIGRDTMRYAGSPLCYHFDELKCPNKGAVVVALGPKGVVGVEKLVIPPLHPLREVRKTFGEILEEEKSNGKTGEYVKVVLTDQRISPENSAALHALFEGKGSLLLELSSCYEVFTDVDGSCGAAGGVKTLAESLTDFWRARHGGADPDDAMSKIIALATARPEHGGWRSDESIGELVNVVKGMKD